MGGKRNKVKEILYGSDGGNSEGLEFGIAETEDAVVVAAERACAGINLLVNSGVDITNSSVVNWNRSGINGDLSGIVVFGSLN